MDTANVGAAVDRPLADVIEELRLWEHPRLPLMLSPRILARAEWIDWALRSDGRRSMAAQIDAQRDAANDAEEEGGFTAGFAAEGCRLRLEADRHQLVKLKPRTVTEFDLKRRELERIDSDLRALSSEAQTDQTHGAAQRQPTEAPATLPATAPAPASAPAQRSKPVRFDPFRRELAAVVQALQEAGKPIDAHVVIEALKARARPEGPIFGSTATSIKWYDSKEEDRETSFADIGRRLRDLLDREPPAE